MKLSDYVMKFLVDRGTDTVFTISGGGIMHLLDSLGSNPNLAYYCNYHEQATAAAAEGWARVRNRPGVTLVTVGPGALNLISGLAGAWYDSVPIIALTGQVRRDLIADYSKVRQKGPQEAPNVELARPVTKYATTVMDPLRIRYEMEKAWHIALEGRPGPVLIDVPLDVQAAEIDPASLAGFDAGAEFPQSAGEEIEPGIQALLEMLQASKRPVLVGGTGLHWSGAVGRFVGLAERLNIPIVLPFTGKDLVPEVHPLNLGIFGTAGQRRANFTIQNADLILSFGVGYSVAKVGFNSSGFAPKAKKVVVDIDQGQLQETVIKPDLGIQADAGEILSRLQDAIVKRTFSFSAKWLPACQGWKAKYPMVGEEAYAGTDFVNSYAFADRLSTHLGSDNVLVTGNGLDAWSYIQGYKVQPGQRTFTSNNWGSMGWALPLAIGACIGNNKKPTACLTGDGSLQWNIQELLFLQCHRIPVKIFVFNNRGYSSIRTTQTSFFEGRFVGADATSGVADVSYELLAKAYGLGYVKIGDNAGLDEGISSVLQLQGPVICELSIAPGQGIAPKASAFRNASGKLESRPIEDMAPPLPREEVYANMHLFDDES